MEKRVKSRFSHRQINLFPVGQYGKFLAVVKSCISLPDTFSDREYAVSFNQRVEV